MSKKWVKKMTRKISQQNDSKNKSTNWLKKWVNKMTQKMSQQIDSKNESTNWLKKWVNKMTQKMSQQIDSKNVNKLTQKMSQQIDSKNESTKCCFVVYALRACYFCCLRGFARVVCCCLRASRVLFLLFCQHFVLAKKNNTWLIYAPVISNKQ